MTWSRFPFPECGACHRAWVDCPHRGCPGGGTIEADLARNLFRCAHCQVPQDRAHVRFVCVCGHGFDAVSVDLTRQEVDRATEALVTMMRRERLGVADIRSAGESSLRRWLERLAKSVGEPLGEMILNLAGSFVKSLLS